MLTRHRGNSLTKDVREYRRKGREKAEGTGRGAGRLGRNLVCNYFKVHLTRAMHSAGEGPLTNGEKARSVTVAVAAA